MVSGRTLSGRVLGCNLQRIELSRFSMFPSNMAALLQSLLDNKHGKTNGLHFTTSLSGCSLGCVLAVP